MEVICWEWQGKAADAGDEAAAWLTRYLDNGKDFRLVRYSGEVSECMGCQHGSAPAVDWAGGHVTPSPQMLEVDSCMSSNRQA